MRGILKFKWGDKKGACEDWKRSLELGNQEAEDMINKYCK
jgi:hypothetical protein